MRETMPKFIYPNLRKWKNIFKSKHFTSSFCFLFSAITIIFIFASILLVVQNTHTIKDEMESEASHVAISIQDILNSVRNNATLVGSLPSVSTVLNHPNPSIDQLSVMIKDVSSFSTMYDYDNMGIFFELSKRIFDSDYGIYRYSDYLHPDFLNAIYKAQSYERWFLLLSLDNMDPSDSPALLTYVHRLPYHETHGKGFITFSLSIPYLRKQTADIIGKTDYPATVCFQEQLLWSTQEGIALGWDNAKTPAANAAVLFPHARSYSFTTEDGTEVTFYINTSQLFHRHLEGLQPLFSAWLLSAVFILALAFLFAFLMLRPMDAMMRKIGLPTYTEVPSSRLDEYSLLNDALDNMAVQLKNIDSVMSENKLLIREQLLHGILYGYVDLGHLTAQYEKNGICFSFSNFCLILMVLPKLEEIDDLAKLEQTRLLARNNAVTALSNLGTCYSAYLGNKHIALIVNTDQWEHLRTALLKICVVINTSLKETISLSPLFSISICSQDSPNLHQALVQAERLLLFSSGETNDFVYFSSQQDYTPTIAPDLSLQLTQCIMDKDSALLSALADDLERQYLPSGTSLQEARRLSSMILCSVFVNLMELNIETRENLLTGALSRLETAQTSEECMRIVFGCLCSLAGDTAKISDEAHSYIHKAIRYLEAHYAESLSIPLIASHTGVSAIYLNRIFKLSTGKTVSEYLNDYRIAQSLPMLADSSRTIVHISEAVGYGDVRSYIRFFKKFYGMTPSEYRKSSMPKL